SISLEPNGGRTGLLVAAGLGAGTILGAGVATAGVVFGARSFESGRAGRRVPTTDRSTVCAGGFFAGPSATTKLSLSGFTCSRPRTGSRRRTSPRVPRH